MTRTMHASEAGLTLIEVVIAVTLLSMLSVGMLEAIRMGFGALDRTNLRLMEDRRVAGAQRVLEQEIAGLIPVKALCPGQDQAPVAPFAFFEGQPQSMRLISTYSLQEAWRGHPYIDEFQVISGAGGRGVRLIVNEVPYNGPLSARHACLGMAPDPESGRMVPQFAPIVAGPQSFVLADKLASCRFWYLEPAKPPAVEHWRSDWVLPQWPLGIRVEMAPLPEDSRTRLRPLTVTVPIAINRSPDIDYVDY